MNLRWRTFRGRSAAAAITIAAVLACLTALPSASTAEPSLGALDAELGQEQAHQQALQSSLGGLAQMINSLSGQIALVQSREAVVQSDLAQDRVRLAATAAALARERQLVALLRARLARGRMLLARQLVSNYESDDPDLMSVLLEANGFKDLLEKVSFLRDAEHQQQAVIAFTRIAKAKADAATARLTMLELSDEQITEDAALHAQALAGMNSLLQSKQGALEHAQALQQAALAASQARSGQIQGQISQLEAQQEAEQEAEQQAAERQAAAQQPGGGGTGAGVSVGGSGGWVIPGSIVECESGGQNLPPNGAGASGYYQIVPGTWKEYGGTGSSAYGATRSEQNEVASRIWAGGSGASNWVCAGMVGIH